MPNIVAHTIALGMPNTKAKTKQKVYVSSP